MASGFTGLVIGFSHGWNIAQDVHTRSVGRYHDHREGAVGRCIFIEVGLDHDDQDVRNRGVRREPLMAVDDPFIAVSDCLGGQQCRIGSGTRLGHRETGANFLIEQRLHPRDLLLLCPAEREQFSVARIGSVVAKDSWRQWRLAQDFVHQAEFDLPKTAATEFGR